MERLSSLATAVEQHGTLATLPEMTSPLFDTNFKTSLDRPKKLVTLDVDGTILPDKPELTGRMMNFLYANDLLNESTATQVEVCGRMLPLTAKQTFEALQDEHHEHGESNSLTTRRQLYDPLNKMHDRQIAGRKRSEVNAIANEVIRLCLYEAYQPVLEEIELHMDDDAYVALISGSPDFLIQALKRALGLTIATGTQLRKSGEGRYHPSAPSSPRGRDKHIIVDGMLRRLSFDLMRKQNIPTSIESLGGKRLMGLEEIPQEHRFELSAAYGDTIYDFSMMAKAKDPVVVFSHRELSAPVKADLYQHALDFGWRTLDVDAPTDPFYNYRYFPQKEGLS
ncbi:MAG: hypothetical protein ABIR91_00335 [Candidatus Saccharimonadales bacterium]